MSKSPFKIAPIVLKRLIQDTGIKRSKIHEATNYCRKTFNHVLNRAGYLPGDKEAYKRQIERQVLFVPGAIAWLEKEGLTSADFWEPDKHPHALNSWPKGQRPQKTKKIFHINWEVEMVTPEAKKVFKFFKDPFIDDVQSEADIYMSDEHRYIEAAMLDAARHSGFLAVSGDVGSGKSTIRKKVFAQLKRDNNVLIISPRCIDKSRLTASMISDAVVRDISNETPRLHLEDKTRQVIRLLTERADNSQRHCLFLEEAHDLSEKTLKYLKRFYELEELEDGFRRLLGIILVGQLEMKRKLDERSSFDAREVIRRCQIVELGPLSGENDLEKYLGLKFKKAGIKPENVFEDDAYQAIRDRLTLQNGRKKVSHIYPLLLNNYAAKAINLAAKCGQKKVTAAVVYEI